jgi:multidrug resistance efflux pump
MSATLPLLESPKPPPPGGGEDPARREADGGARLAGAGFRRFLRRSFRTLGVLLVAAMGGFLISQHLLPRAVPVGEALAAGEPRAAADEDTAKLVVCFGYADLDGGVATLYPTQPGRVEKILVKENETVPAGAALLRLADRAARLQVEEARATLDEAGARLTKAEKGPELQRLKIEDQEASVNMARYRLASAKHTLAARQEKLKGDAIGRIRDDPTTVEGVASVAKRVQEFEEVVTSEEKKLASLKVEDPAAELKRVRAEVATMRARLSEAEQALDERTLRAPEAGEVLRILVAPGELLSAAPKKMAIQFCPSRPHIVRAEVDQQFAPRVKVGQPALIEDEYSSANSLHGRVTRISDWYTQRREIADEQLQLKDVRTLECIVALDPGQPPLRIGQRVRVTINRAKP